MSECGGRFASCRSFAAFLLPQACPLDAGATCLLGVSPFSGWPRPGFHPATSLPHALVAATVLVANGTLGSSRSGCSSVSLPLASPLKRAARSPYSPVFKSNRKEMPLLLLLHSGRVWACSDGQLCCWPCAWPSAHWPSLRRCSRRSCTARAVALTSATDWRLKQGLRVALATRQSRPDGWTSHSAPEMRPRKNLEQKHFRSKYFKERRTGRGSCLRPSYTRCVGSMRFGGLSQNTSCCLVFSTVPSGRVLNGGGVVTAGGVGVGVGVGVEEEEQEEGVGNNVLGQAQGTLRLPLQQVPPETRCSSTRK